MMIIMLSIVGCSACPIIINQAGQIYETMQLTYSGFYPYGYNLTGTLTEIDDLCKPQMNKMILTRISDSCDLAHQMNNAEGSQVLIFYDQHFDYFQSTSLTILFISNQTSTRIHNIINSTITVVFPINKAALPIIKYVTYDYDQPIEALQEIQLLRKTLQFDIIPIYLIKYLHCNDISYDCLYFNEGKLPVRRWFAQIVVELYIFEEYGFDIWSDFRVRYVKECIIFETYQEIETCQRILWAQLNINETQLLMLDANYIEYIVEQQVELSLVIDVYRNEQGLILINDQYIFGNYLITKQNQSVIFNALCQSYSEEMPPSCQRLDYINKEPTEYQQINTTMILIIGFITVGLMTFFTRRYFKKRHLLDQVKENLIEQEMN